MLSCSLVFGGRTTTIKVFHVFESFGKETQEIKNSIIMNYDTEGFLIDSTIYSHSLPLRASSGILHHKTTFQQNKPDIPDQEPAPRPQD